MWQVAQPVTIPTWFMTDFDDPEKLVVDLWHVSHGCAVGMWFVGFPNAPVPLWQVAQPVTIPV